MPTSYFQIFRIFKVVLFVCTICYKGSLFAQNCSPIPKVLLNKNISLPSKSITTKSLLLLVEKQVAINFSYQENIVSLSQIIHFDKHENRLEVLLDSLSIRTNTIFCFIGNSTIVIKPKIEKQNKVIVYGLIKDKQTGDRIIGANVIVSSHKVYTETNNEGIFFLRLYPGTYNIKFSIVGYENIERVVQVTDNIFLEIDIESKKLAPVIVVADDKSTGETIGNEPGKISFKSKLMSNISPLFGESDVFRALLLMPGVQSVGEGLSGVSIRGGSPDQNLVLLDGIQVYNPTHLFGFYSIFNPGLVQNVTMYKSDFNSQYGGRVSGVVEVETKEGNTNKISGNASLGLIGAGFVLEGPLSKAQKTTFVIGARRSYIDAMLSPFLEANSNRNNVGFLSTYSFYDLNGKIVHRFSPTSKLTLNFYLGRDNTVVSNVFNLAQPQRVIEEKDKQESEWGNTIYSIKWHKVFNKKNILRTQAWNSRYVFNNINQYTFKLSNGQESSEDFYNYKLSSKINDFGFSTELVHLGSKLDYTIGAQSIYHTFQPGITTIASNFQNIEPLNYSSNQIFGVESSLYGDTEIKFKYGINIKTGLRLTSFNASSTYNYIQPRILVKKQIKKNSNLYFGYVEMQQFMHLLQNFSFGIPNNLWVLSTEKIKPIVSKQLSLGYIYKMPKSNIGIDFYSKNLLNLLEYRENTNYLVSSQNWEEKVTTGRGRIQGFEIFAEKVVGKFTGWLSYNYSINTRQFAEILNGEEFYSANDRRHDFKSSISYKLKKNVLISANFVYATGNPFTLPEQIYYGIDASGNPAEILLPGERNAFRMNHYHRADINYSYFSKNKLGEYVFSFGVYNVYNNPNPFFITPGYNDSGTRVLRQFTLFPFFPSFTVNQKF